MCTTPVSTGVVPVKPAVHHFKAMIHDGNSVTHAKRNEYENANAKNTNSQRASQGQYSTDNAQRLAVLGAVGFSAMKNRRRNQPRE